MTYLTPESDLNCQRRWREKNRSLGLNGRGKPRKSTCGRPFSTQLPFNSPEYYMLIAARTRAKQKGLPFTITDKDVVMPEFCPILGIPLFRGKGGHTFNSPSLDRIVPELGYVPGNVHVISRKANTMKSNASLQELVLLGQWAVRRIHGEVQSA